MPAKLPTNAELAERFELLADMLELDGADAFRLAAYRRAAARIRDSAVPVAQLAVDGKATRLSGNRRHDRGQDRRGRRDRGHERARQAAGEAAARARRGDARPGPRPKTARKLWSELGVESLDDLRTAAEQERLRGLPGLGAKTEEKILKSLAAPPKASAATGRTLLGKALPCRPPRRGRDRGERPGRPGLRGRERSPRCETTKDLDLIATATDPPALTAFFAEREWVAEVVALGGTKATVVSHEGFRFDLRVVPPESYGNLLQHFTGSKDHNVALREDAVRRGLSVSEYGVLDVESGETFQAADEEAVYEHLGYAWIPPELRENRGELEAARDGGLPQLVELADLQGDLHMHTDWSDGRATLEEMVLASKERGHRYIAICDHARRLRDGRLEAQTEAIAALNGGLRDHGARGHRGRHPSRRQPGHGRRGAGRARLGDGLDSLRLRRLARAPHRAAGGGDGAPARRLHRPPDRAEDQQEACRTSSTSSASARPPVETGTFLEINAQPDRLDLTDTLARAAAEAGVRIVVSTDAHRLHELDNLELGVAQARRGWLTAEQVVNTRTWAEVKKLMKR